MSMVIEEPKQKETFTQRKRRQQREVLSFLFHFSIRAANLPSRPKTAPESPPRPNVPPKMPPAAMKLWRRVHSTHQTRGLR